MQCIKGLTAAEAIYVDRLDKVLVRKDMSDPLTGAVSKTKGRYDDDVWREVTWEEASHLLVDMTVGIIKKFGGNAIGTYGFRVILAASKGTSTDISGMLEIEKRDGVSPYESLRQTKGLFYPAPNYESASAGGIKRKYGNQETEWPDRPYGYFPHKDGRARFKLCEQDYSRAREILAKVERIGRDSGALAVDHYDVLKEIRDNGLPPELPDFEALALPLAAQRQGNAFPLWLNLGVVFEHSHTAKTIRSAITRRLVPEMYVEVNPEDAARWHIEDGEWVRVVTPRIDAETGENCFYEARVSIGTDSRVRPARNLVMAGQIFSPWNLSVADSADPKKNRWLVNGVSSRLFDPVSGQADFKHLKARIEKIA